MIRLSIWCVIFSHLLLSCTSTNSAKKDKEPLNIIWTKDVPAKHEIINGSAITYEDMIYVFSGKEGRLMKYNPVNYTWLDLAGMPGPRKEPGVTLWQDKIVVAGGIDDSSNFMRRVDYYDLKLNVWKEMTSLPDPRCRLTLSVLGGQLISSSGVCGTNERTYGDCLDILIYNDTSKIWKTQGMLKKGRFGHASVSDGNKMYAIGGYGFEKGTGTFYMDYKMKEVGFKKEIPVPRGNFGAVLVGDYILTYGGKVQSADSPMEKYNIVNDTWESLGNCPFWTDRFAYTRWHDRIYLFGGAQNPMSVWKGDIVFK